MIRDVPGIEVLGPAALADRVRTAAASFGAAVHSPGAQGQPSLTGRIVLVHADHGGPGNGPDAARQAIAAGAALVVGVAAPRAQAVRLAFFAAGATDILLPSCPEAELTRHLERLVRTVALGRRLRRQDGEIVLLSALARRLLRSPDAPTMLGDALDALGRSLALDYAEARVLPATLHAGGETALSVSWAPDRGAHPLPAGALAAEDLDALRSRRPVRFAEGGVPWLALPLCARGRALAVLRVRGAGGVALDEDELALLYGAGNLVASALESAERFALLAGRSRDLAALAAERSREVEEQRALFQAVIDTLPFSLHAIDRAFRIVVWNRGREAGPLGRPRGEVLGCNIWTAIGEDPELREEYEGVFATGQTRVTEVQSRADVPPVTYRVEKVPMRLASSPEVSHVITFARDVTAQRTFERSMAQAEKLAAVGRLAAGIAHEINNPLATIAGCAESLRGLLAAPLEESEREEARADAGLIEDEAYRCKEILGGMLDFSRSHADRREPCEPDEIARRALRLLRHNPRVASVRLTLETEDGLPTIEANEDQVVQVLLALVINAADAAAAGGSVALRVRRTAAGEVVFSVEDDGPGIPAEIRERIFEPFFTTKPPGQGTGLGLSVAYGLVQAHGGRLDVMSHPGLGARFDVVLPATSAVPAEVTT